MCDHTLLDDWIKKHYAIFFDKLGGQHPALAVREDVTSVEWI